MSESCTCYKLSDEDLEMGTCFYCYENEEVN